MAHPHHQFHRAVLAGHVQYLIHRRQQRSAAFQREPFVAQIALLQSLLKQIGPHQQIKRALVTNADVDVARFPFEPFLNPAPPLRVGNVHELHAHAAAIDASRFPRPLVIDGQVGMRLRRQQAQRVQFRLQIAKLPEQPKHPFPLVVLNDCRSRTPARIAR